MSGLRSAAWAVTFAVALAAAFSGGYARCGECPVSVVFGYDSLLSGGDARFAEAKGRLIAKFLDGGGLQAEVFPDTKFSEALSGKCSVVHLVCVERPSEGMLKSLRGFISGGGRVAVHHSDSQALAKIMGMRITGIERPPDGVWTKMRFRGGPKQPLSGVFSFKTPSCIGVVPDAGGVQVAALWECENGAPGAPACLSGPSGVWMTAVPNESVSEESGRILLASITGACNPALLREAALSLRKNLWRAAGSSSEKELRACAAGLTGGRRAEFEKIISGISGKLAAADGKISEGAFPEAVLSLIKLSAEVSVLSGLTVRVSMPETAAVWDDMRHSAKDPAGTADLLRSAGVTDVFLKAPRLVWRDGHAGFSSENDASALKRMRTVLNAYKERGLKVHAWIFAFSPEGFSDEVWDEKCKSGENADYTGRKAGEKWLDPASLRVREELAAVCCFYVLNNRFDGVHLDYVRYTEHYSFGCIGKRWQKDFAAETGVIFTNWVKETAASEPLREKFFGYRTGCVSDALEYVREKLAEKAPECVLSAAVYGGYPQCVVSVGQDWRAWLENDLVDFVVPMDYTDKNSLFEKWVKSQIRSREDGRRIFPGIGVNADGVRLDLNKTAGQINAAAAAGAAGVSFFRLDGKMLFEILPGLARCRQP